MFEDVEDVQVHPVVQNAVIVALWLPVIALLWAVGLGSLGIGYQIATGQATADVSLAAGILESDIVILAVGAALVILYIMVSKATFGGDTVTSAIETTQEVTDGGQDIE